MRPPSFALFVAILLRMLPQTSATAAHVSEEPHINTFSIVAFDPDTGDLGVAVQSRYFAVGSVVPWAKAGVGAIATQAMARISFGPTGLDLLAAGKPAPEVLEALLASDAKSAVRQVAIVDGKGKVAVHTGADCLDWAGHHAGERFVVQGNILAGPEVVQEMAKAFKSARAKPESELADWLLAALQAGQAAGGDRRGKQSAALLVVRANGGPGGDNDRYVDLRVDDHPDPIVELGRLLGLHNQFHPHLHAPKRLPKPARAAAE
jgi:uncharacterized Ntn-hydrolase superfamily protein